MSAWQLAERGAQVVLYDSFGVATNRGASHGSTRIFRRALFEGIAYVPLIERSAELWAELGVSHPEARLRVTGGLTIGPSAGGIVERALEAARAGMVDVELLDNDELSRRFPQHALQSDDIAMFEPGAGVIPAEASVAAAVTQATTRGAVLRAETRVHQIRADSSRIVLDTDLGPEYADAVVVAAGAELDSLIPDLTLPLTVEKSMHVWFNSNGDAKWSGQEFPVFVRESGLLHGWGIGDIGDGRVKIGLGTAKPEVRDLGTYLQNPPQPAPVELQPVSAYVRSALTGLDPLPVAATPCLNTFTPDGDFILGCHPAEPRIVLAGAGSGHSFKHAPAIGQIAAELALTGKTTLGIETFDPARFSA